MENDLRLSQGKRLNINGVEYAFFGSVSQENIFVFRQIEEGRYARYRVTNFRGTDSEGFSGDVKELSVGDGRLFRDLWERCENPIEQVKLGKHIRFNT